MRTSSGSLRGSVHLWHFCSWMSTPKGKPSIAERVARLEEMVNLLLAAALRGRVMPGDRQRIKKHLAVDRKERRVPTPIETGERCPACSSPLPDPHAARCPYCSILLGVARQTRREVDRNRRRVAKAVGEPKPG